MPEFAATVLITRPEPAASALSDRLRAVGLQSIVLPLIAFAPPPDPAAARRQLLARLPADQAIFTSRNAVQYALDLVDVVDFGDTPIAAVGKTTAGVLAKRGFSKISTPESGYNSEALLALPVYRLPGGGRRAVILTAPGGRQLIRDTLAERGWDVATAQVYRRVALEPTPLDLQQVEQARELVCLFTSGSAMEACQRMLPERLWRRLLDSRWLVISSRLGQLAEGLGVSSVHLAAGPANRHIAEAAVDLASIR